MVEFFTQTNLGIALLILGQCLLVLIPLLLALAFLMFRPQGLFGEKIIERV